VASFLDSRSKAAEKDLLAAYNNIMKYEDLDF
jgi:hypothetical protein